MFDLKNDAFVYSARGKLDPQGWARQYAPLVRRLAREGAAVAVVDIHERRCRSVAEEIAAAKRRLGSAFARQASIRLERH